jgi:glyoxylase-like metal-dependent hydrolase (beta-lactamase superfamily II)
MHPHSFRLRLGQAAITVFCSAGFRAPLRELMTVPEPDFTPALARLLDEPTTFPCWSIHIALGPASALVDPGRYIAPPGDPWHLPAAEIPPDLGEQMAAAGIDPASITHVIITHLHDDHFGAAWCASGPCFANARHLLSRADWDSADFRKWLADPDSSASQILGRLYARGLVDLVEGGQSLAEGIDLIPAPGETPGHQIVRVHSGGQTLYCLGDLYHHALEVSRPEWMAEWTDAEAARRSRALLSECALTEDALLIAAHIPSLGRLRRIPAGVEWQPLALDSNP